MKAKQVRPEAAKHVRTGQVWIEDGRVFLYWKVGGTTAKMARLIPCDRAGRRARNSRPCRDARKITVAGWDLWRDAR